MFSLRVLSLAVFIQAVLSFRGGPVGIHTVNHWRLARRSQVSQSESQLFSTSQTDVQSTFKSPKDEEFPARHFKQPLDHFDGSVKHTFQQRYWVNDRHYTEGGPVIVLDGGETSGEDRLPFLDTGILEILANATGGLGIVLEHRYYGACNRLFCL